ncbi:MAG: trypsin-like peptidase domain-containing protein [Actinomycetota bacterium]
MSEPTPPPSGSFPEPDLPKPPIWQERAETTASSSHPPIVPTNPAPTMPTPSTPAAPTPAAPTPASGVGAGNPPRWPAVPPTAGATTTSFGAAPTTPPAPRRRAGLVALALIALLALAAGAFFLGRSFGDNETATVPAVAAAPEAPTEIPEVAAEPEPTEAPEPEPTEVPPTAVPATPVPTVPNDATIEPSPLAGAEEPVAAVAQAVSPAVVLIQNQLGQGSGIIYDEAGLILTNAHVVGDSTEVSVQLASGIRVPGQVLGADSNTDVAVVKIDGEAEFGVAPLAPSSSVQVGQLAVAIGSPFGLDQTVTSGIVSAKGRVVGTVAMIQTDAPINPGNSGGALADRQGRVIGMNTSIRTDGSGGNIGVGFAIPADTMLLIAERIIAGESLEQGYLGVTGETPLIGEPGVVVTEVLIGTGAEAAGVLVDDRIVGFNGTEIRDMGDLAAAVRLQAPEAIVSIDVVRGGVAISIPVTLGTLPN